MNILIKCFEVFMNFIYCFFKLLPTKNKICFISRQSDKVNIDFRLLVDEIKVEAPDVKIVILTKTLKKGLIQKVKYFFHMSLLFLTCIYFTEKLICVNLS